VIYLPPNFIGGGKIFKPATGVIDTDCHAIKVSQCEKYRQKSRDILTVLKILTGK